MAFKTKREIEMNTKREAQKMGLFDFISYVFTDSRFKYVPDNIKNKYFFMTMRRLSIMYPIQVEALSLLHAPNKAVILDYWNRMLSRQMTKMPRWTYTKAEKAEKKAKSKIEPQMVREYINFHRLSEKDFDFALKLYPKEFEKEVLGFWYGRYPKVEQMKRIGKATKHQSDRQTDFSLL